MKTIAIGPERDVPSWNWVGFDTGRELSKHYNVVYFESVRAPVKADVILLIKQIPSLNFMEFANKRRTKVIYCPIDHYQSRDQIQKDGMVLSKIDMIVTHCERLNPLLRRYCGTIKFIDHNNKYVLPKMSTYKENGFVLWVGGCQYAAYLINFLQKHPLDIDVKICTDLENGRAKAAACELANKLGFKLQITSNSINNHEAIVWNERNQLELMENAKAAIDIKGEDDFNQYYKPPTKAQKYIGSGIPFAINPNSYSTEYFQNRGFAICSPLHKQKWFSHDYWEATQLAGTKIRQETSLKNVGLKFKQYIDELLKK